LYGIRPCSYRVVVAPNPHIHGRKDFPGSPVIWIALDVAFDLRDQSLDRAICLGLRALRARSLGAGHIRRAEHEVKCHRTDREQRETGNGGAASTPERWRIRDRFLGSYSIGSRKEAARYLNLSGFRLGRADQAGGSVPVDFVQLVTIDGYIAAATRRALPS